MIEESSELTKELTHWIRGKGDILKILEEMADVKISLEAVEQVFIIDNDTKEIYDGYYINKLLRLEQRLYEKSIE